MTTTEPPSPDTFVISLPSTWMEVPLDPDELVTFVRDRTSERSPEVVDTIEFRRLLVLLRRLGEQMQSGGLVFAAVSSEEIRLDDPDTPGDEPYFLVAMAWLATMHAEQFDTERIAFLQVQAAVDPEPVEPGRRRVERPRVVELPGGLAYRDVCVQSVRTQDGESTEVLECRYHMLVGEGEGMAVLGFTTSNVELAEEMIQLFEGVAATLQFVAA